MALTHARPHGKPVPALCDHFRPHEPTLLERLSLARDSMVIARFATRYGLERALARKELARARSEILLVIRLLERARVRAKKLESRLPPEIDEILQTSRTLGRELETLAAKLSSMN